MELLYYADPAQHFTTAGYDLDALVRDLDRDLGRDLGRDPDRDLDRDLSDE